MSRLDDALKKLLDLALVKKNDDGMYSVHRLTQKAFLFREDGAHPAHIQSAFLAAASLVYKVFPRLEGVGLFDKWKECSLSLPHVQSLITWWEFSYGGKMCSLPSSNELEAVIESCVWYQYEIGELGESLRLIDIGCEMVCDKEGFIYAQLCHTAAVIYYEKNDLIRCRKYMDTALRIREGKLDADDPNLLNTSNNNANLLLAEGKLEDARNMYMLVKETRRAKGDSMTYLAKCEMSIGRVYHFEKDYDNAEASFAAAKKTFLDNGLGQSWMMGL